MKQTCVRNYRSSALQILMLAALMSMSLRTSASANEQPVASKSSNKYLNLKPVSAPPGVVFPEKKEVSNSEKFANSVFARLSRDRLIAQTPSQKRRATVTFGVAKDGTVYNAKVLTSSGDPVFDLSILESVLSSAPFEPSLDGPNGDVTEFQTSPNSETDCKLSAGAATLFSEHPDFQKKIVAFHRIPFSVLDHYPKFFTENELDTAANLSFYSLATSEDNLIARLKIFYSSWQDYILKNPLAQKKDILKHAKDLEEKFGGLSCFGELDKASIDYLKKCEMPAI